MGDDFEPFRKDVRFLKCEDSEIRPLIESLDFIENKKRWGYAFRFGHIEITEKDFRLIADAMRADI